MFAHCYWSATGRWARAYERSEPGLMGKDPLDGSEVHLGRTGFVDDLAAITTDIQAVGIRPGASSHEVLVAKDQGNLRLLGESLADAL